ncbi:hypothetical protein ADL01_37945 [Streptomyces sp. NRRL WC-3618]|uniref:hypothetical protein n=1 Tax=Streptomyces sp. NRRL WC-3618 TaxID=1519490 RepID=UPI0006B06A4B|nr:hypothetical protein [Streptomyces sp. NRRL WC-3618]KOV58474.1 hypothetical protein ADL01_37945 [Streptomyces sp. NRRL WC-3618]
MTDARTAIVAGLRRLGEEGRPASEAARWAMRKMRETGETGKTGDDFKVFQLMVHFFGAYHVPVERLRELERWEGLDTGGPLTDAELDAVVGPLTVRETPPS